MASYGGTTTDEPANPEPVADELVASTAARNLLGLTRTQFESLLWRGVLPYVFDETSGVRMFARADLDALIARGPDAPLIWTGLDYDERDLEIFSPQAVAAVHAEECARCARVALGQEPRD